MLTERDRGYPDETNLSTVLAAVQKIEDKTALANYLENLAADPENT